MTPAMIVQPMEKCQILRLLKLMSQVRQVWYFKLDMEVKVKA